MHATHELDVQGRRAAGGEGGDEASALLRPISDDAPLVSSAAAATAEGAPAWEVRALPATAGPGDERIAVLRSRRWPGAVTVGFGRRRWANVYFGDGLDLALDAYQLQLPALPPAAVAMRNADGSAVFAEQPDVAEDPEAAARATEAAEAADAAAAAAAAEEVRGSDEAAVAEEAASS